MKLHQVVAVLGFIAAGASATPGGYSDRDKNADKYKNHNGDNNGDYSHGKGDNYNGGYSHGKGDNHNGDYSHGKGGYSKGGKHGDHNGDYSDGNGDYSHGKGGYSKGGKHGDHNGDYSHGKGGYQCKKYDWDIERCDWCPYKPYHPRDLDGLEARGNYGGGYGGGYGKSCKRTCPDDKKKCKKYSWDYSKVTYSTSFDDYTKCSAGDSYKVVGKIGPCGDWGSYGSKQCLFVEYDDWDKYSDKTAYLGIYATKEEGPKKKEELNFNKWCKKNKCVVPLDKLPGYPKLCKKSIWVGIDDDQCKEKKHYGGYGGGYGKGKGKGKGKKHGYGDNYDDNKDSYGNNYGNNYDDNNNNKDKRGNDNYDDNKDNYGDNYDNNKDNYDNGDNYGTDGYGYGHGSGYGYHSVKYIEVDIDCKYGKKCSEWCCCA